MANHIWRRLFGWLRRSPQGTINLERQRNKRMKHSAHKRKQVMTWTMIQQELPSGWQRGAGIGESDDSLVIIRAPHALFLIQTLMVTHGELHATIEEEHWQIGQKSIENPLRSMARLIPALQSKQPEHADLPILKVIVLPPAVLLPNDPLLRQIEQNQIVLHDEELLSYLLRKHASVTSQV